MRRKQLRVAAETGNGPRKSARRSDDPPFKGEIAFDLTFEMFGERFSRKVKAVYEHRPQEGFPYIELGDTAYHLEVLLAPDEVRANLGIPELHGIDGPQWVAIPDADLLPGEAADAIFDMIDERCRQDDAKRRAAAAGK